LAQSAELDREGCAVLAGALGDTPETVMSVHRLRRGICRAFAAGTPERPAAAIVQSHHVPTEPAAFGDDPEQIWSLLREIDGWLSVHVALAMGAPLARLMAAATGQPRSLLEEIYYVLSRPVASWENPAVRRLTLADLPLMEASAAALEMTHWRYESAAALVTESFAAGAVIDDRLVAIAFASARATRHAEVGVVTAAPWRGRGLSTAAASLVCADIERAGQIPVWSTSAENFASQRVGAKLGFVEVSRRVYVNPV